MSPKQEIELIEIAFERQAEELAALRAHHQREITNLVTEMAARLNNSER